MTIDPTTGVDQRPQTVGDVNVDFVALWGACRKSLSACWAWVIPRLSSLLRRVVVLVKEARPAHRWTAAAALGLVLAFVAGYFVSGSLNSGPSTQTPVAAAGGVSSSPAPSASQASEITTRIPVLTVVELNGTNEGRVVDVTLKLTHESNSTAPFQVAFMEDTPGGHGSQLRSSVWMAALVAALQRDTDLAGYRLTASIPGSVDGPSAGGVLCLAILGLLEGRQFPQDLAVTGTILPDGSIGQVGGIAQKINAAGQRGLRRVIVPEHLRFEPLQGDAGIVDLKAAAERAHVAFLPTSEMVGAFQIAFRDAHGRSHSHSIDSVKPAPELDTFLAARSVELLTEAGKTWKTFDGEADKLQQNEQYGNLVMGLAEKAAEALEAGFVLAGHSDSLTFHAAVEGRKRWQPVMRSAARKTTTLATQQLDSELATSLQPFNSPATLAESWITQTNRSPFATQYFVDLETLCATPLSVTVTGAAFLNRDENQRTAGPGQNSVKPATADSETNRKMKEVQLLVAITGRVTLEATARDLVEISRRLPNRPFPPGRADRVERLFHSVLTTIDQTLLSNVVEPLAESLQVSTADALLRLVQEDLLMLYYVATVQTAEQLHGRLEQLRARGESNDLLAAATAQLCATQVALASGILVRWTELNAVSDEEGATRFGRKATLSRLLWAARDNAIRSIGECMAHDIPCPRAIEFLQNAELMRDDQESDPVDALVTYWKAALQAQALRLLFTPDDTRSVPK